ncbi:SH3 domain [Chlorella sorokiniana]|uniref:SH3 domain n=1 Tax=Chlorella sorokiniana TaxID=3076 RepID=A0A2P6U2Z3_CHLSO|nr:SH3 domain [Chlorella sorokiniana]|eukprot:PRW60681.1 SH3 domain [Chlorella sorokiniana]
MPETAARSQSLNARNHPDPMAKAPCRRRRAPAVLRWALPVLLLAWLATAGAEEPANLAATEPPGDATPHRGRRLEQVPTTLPACKAQLATSQKQLGTCKTQLNTTTVAKKTCATKLTACTQSATAKQLSGCQRRGATYNGNAASAGTRLQRCNSDRDALAKENKKLRAAAAAQAKRSAPVVKAAAAKSSAPAVAAVAAKGSTPVAKVATVAAEPDPLVACQQQAALQATQIELDSVNAALVARDADVAALQEQLAAANEQLQLCGEEQEQLAAARWQLSQLQQVYTVTDGLLNQTRDDLDKVSAQVDGLRDANEEYVACANQLISLQIANETNAQAAGECQGQLADVERSYQECITRNRRLLKLPGGRPGLSRTTA